MAVSTGRYNFASDNTAAICPPAWAALAEANSGSEVSYGDDTWTRRVVEGVRDIFEKDCEAFLVFNGTAANALALAHLGRSYHGVICHERAHSQTMSAVHRNFFREGQSLSRRREQTGNWILAKLNGRSSGIPTFTHQSRGC
jgi:Threonine aldolase